MSDIDAKIGAVLDRFDADIGRVTETLGPILQSDSVDALSEAEADDKKTAVPYALSAYALSSMLFAYLRSEGRDTAVVMPELARVKERLERLSAPSRQGSEPASEDSERGQASTQPSRRVGKSSKAAGKHMRFDEPSSGPKRTKKAKARG